MNKEEMEIITLGDIFRNLETEEQAFEFLKYIKNLQQEIQELKEKIKTYEDPKDLTLMFMYCDEKAKDKIRELENQQKEFINYMMNTIENITHDETDDEEIKGYLIQRGNTFKEILSKYKEIIGGM